MNHLQKILCPVDLSDNSDWAIELATKLAKINNAQLVFLYVAPQWLPQESMLGSEYIDKTLAEDQALFMALRPTDATVKFDHIFTHGNPGPEIVRAAESHDLVVMSTHGRTGISRFLMGNVAEYTLRHASCPVLTIKPRKVKPNQDQPGSDQQDQQQFVTSIMRQVNPVKGEDKIADVVAELNRAKESAAPVVDLYGKCVGILTQGDIEKYQDLYQRFEQRDESVIDEMFVTDEYGQRRPKNYDFDLVQRHMNSPVVTIANDQSCDKARQLFFDHPNIHHLVVVDSQNQPVGIIDTGDLSQCPAQGTARTKPANEPS